MKRNTKRVSVAAIVLGTSLLAAQGAAEVSFDQCDSGRVCGWGNNDYRWLIIERNSGLGIANQSGDASDELDSWANRSTRDARGYDDWNGRGDCQTFRSGSSDSNVAPWNSDEVSSTATNGGC